MEQVTQTDPAVPPEAAAPQEEGPEGASPARMAPAARGQGASPASGPPPGTGQEALEMERAALAGQRERNRLERARLAAEEQVRQIGRLDGRIKSLDDLITMPEYGEFYALVKKGADLVQAYKVTCYDRLVKQAAEAASRQTMRSVASRQHLTALAGQPGEGGYAAVPAEVAAEFRLAKPGISDQEIRRKWRQFQNYKRQ